MSSSSKKKSTTPDPAIARSIFNLLRNEDDEFTRRDIILSLKNKYPVKMLREVISNLLESGHLLDDESIIEATDKADKDYPDEDEEEISHKRGKGDDDDEDEGSPQSIRDRAFALERAFASMNKTVTEVTFIRNPDGEPVGIKYKVLEEEELLF